MQTKKTEKACRVIDTLVLEDINDTIAWHGSKIAPDIRMLNILVTHRIAINFCLALDHYISSCSLFLEQGNKSRKFDKICFNLVKVKILCILC